MELQIKHRNKDNDDAANSRPAYQENRESKDQEYSHQLYASLHGLRVFQVRGIYTPQEDIGRNCNTSSRENADQQQSAIKQLRTPGWTSMGCLNVEGQDINIKYSFGIYFRP